MTTPSLTPEERQRINGVRIRQYDMLTFGHKNGPQGHYRLREAIKEAMRKRP